MQKYYEILNISQNATDEELEQAYSKLKDKYSKDRFLEGEAGNEAAKNLTKLETAYMEIKEYRKKHKISGDSQVVDFSEIEECIKNHDYAKAQRLLDDFSERNAEWHYLQSVLFYKKNWINESKKQLEIALSMDPHNSKYLNSYAKMKEKIEYNDKFYQSGNYNSGSQQNETNQQMGGTNDCCSYCATLCCINLMCNSCCR